LRTRRSGFAVLPALFLLVGCATSEEWGIWKSNTSHFASGEHLFFSARNQGEKAARVTRQDVALSREQSWWGKAITVDQAQIIER
jgi:hypothetical protein